MTRVGERKTRGREIIEVMAPLIELCGHRVMCRTLGEHAFRMEAETAKAAEVVKR